MIQSIERPCPVCASPGADPLMRKAELRLVRCRACSMVYASPVPAAYLDGSFYEDSGRPFYLSPAKLAGDFSPVRFQRELRLFRRFCPRGRVLDVGCSTGAFLFQLRERHPADYDLCGTDVSGPPLDHAETRGVPVLRANFLTHPFQDAFDAVTFWAVLEHVADPKAFLLKTFEILKPGGLCFVLVPNFASLAVKILGAKYRYILPQHINYFTASTLRALACPPFHPVHSTSMHFNPMVILRDRRGTAEPTPDERAELLVKTNALKQKAALAPLRWTYRSAEKLLSTLGLADNCALVLQKATAPASFPSQERLHTTRAAK